MKERKKPFPPPLSNFCYFHLALCIDLFVLGGHMAGWVRYTLERHIDPDSSLILSSLFSEWSFSLSVISNLKTGDANIDPPTPPLRDQSPGNIIWNNDFLFPFKKLSFVIGHRSFLVISFYPTSFWWRPKSMDFMCEILYITYISLKTNMLKFESCFLYNFIKIGLR